MCFVNVGQSEAWEKNPPLNMLKTSHNMQVSPVSAIICRFVRRFKTSVMRTRFEMTVCIEIFNRNSILWINNVMFASLLWSFAIGRISTWKIWGKKSVSNASNVAGNDCRLLWKKCEVEWKKQKIKTVWRHVGWDFGVECLGVVTTACRPLS